MRNALLLLLVVGCSSHNAAPPIMAHSPGRTHVTVVDEYQNVKLDRSIVDAARTPFDEEMRMRLRSLDIRMRRIRDTIPYSWKAWDAARIELGSEIDTLPLYASHAYAMHEQRVAQQMEDLEVALDGLEKFYAQVLYNEACKQRRANR
jgi:hypothetical protein